jgi:hypothetical protein
VSQNTIPEQFSAGAAADREPARAMGSKKDAINNTPAQVPKIEHMCALAEQQGQDETSSRVAEVSVC